jgi:hypothetical protein
VPKIVLRGTCQDKSLPCWIGLLFSNNFLHKMYSRIFLTFIKNHVIFSKVTEVCPLLSFSIVDICGIRKSERNILNKVSRNLSHFSITVFCCKSNSLNLPCMGPNNITTLSLLSATRARKNKMIWSIWKNGGKMILDQIKRSTKIKWSFKIQDHDISKV